MKKRFDELIRYRELVFHLVATDLKVRYRNSVFGFLWTLMNPILLTLVLWAVFVRVGRMNEDNYALFLLSALMVWTFFAQSIERGLSSIVKNKSLFQRIYVPKLIFPLTVVASNLVNLFFFLLAYLVIALFTPVGIHATFPLVVPVVLMTTLIAAGGTFIMATVNVFFRDFTHLTSILLRAAFYVTPIIYPPSILGPNAATYLRFNPMFFPVEAARDVLYRGTLPPPEAWLFGFGYGLLLLVVGLWVFERHQEKFVYYA